MFTIYITLTEGQKPAFKRFLSGKESTNPIDSKFLDDKLKCIHLYQAFHEAGDKKMCTWIEEKQFSNGKAEFPLTLLPPNDLERIATLLTCCSIIEWELLNLTSCRIQNSGLTILQRMLQSSPITIKEVRLDNNDLIFSADHDDSLVKLVNKHKVSKLKIGWNKDADSEQTITTLFTSRESMLKELHIDNMHLSSKMANVIFKSLNKSRELKKLDMADNDITDDSCDVIAKTLKDNTTLEWLNIAGNIMNEEGLRCILDSLLQNGMLKYLRLPYCSCEDIKQQALALQGKIDIEFSSY